MRTLWNRETTSNLKRQNIKEQIFHHFQKGIKTLILLTLLPAAILLKQDNLQNSSFSLSLLNMLELFKKMCFKDSHTSTNKIKIGNKFKKYPRKLRSNNLPSSNSNNGLPSIQFQRNYFRKEKSKENSLQTSYKGLEPINVKDQKDQLNTIFSKLMKYKLKTQAFSAEKILINNAKVEAL